MLPPQTATFSPDKIRKQENRKSLSRSAGKAHSAAPVLSFPGVIQSSGEQPQQGRGCLSTRQRGHQRQQYEQNWKHVQDKRISIEVQGSLHKRNTHLDARATNITDSRYHASAAQNVDIKANGTITMAYSGG